ncbi:hypothetical protein PybrP1_007361, partial [[Pythium] brassicae (nom. inval.)]
GDGDDDSERLLAPVKPSTAAPSSQWLKWEDPNHVLDCAELPNASVIETRRLKNRDSMRRSRQRQRDELEKMRETVAQLERQYEQLCLRTGSDTAVSGLMSANRTSCSCSSSSRRAQSYLEAVDVVKQLGAENLFLKASIQDHASWKLQLHRVLESEAFKKHFDASGAPADELGLEETRAIYGFAPLTDESVNAAILESARQVQDVQRELLASGSGRSPRDHLTMFGWDVRRRRAGNEVAFVFVKRFPNVSARDIVAKSWATDLTLAQFQQIKSETRRLDILQQAGAHALVMGRDVRFPDDRASVFRTVYVRFRKETKYAGLPPPSSSPRDGPGGGDSENAAQPRGRMGYVLGSHSVNPDAADAAQDETLVWADMTLWMEFFDEQDPATGAAAGCEVRWSGRTNYKSERQAYRSAADTLLGLLRWEALTIAPVRTLT